MPNLQYRHKAIQAFSSHLKQHSTSHRGWSSERLGRLVLGALRTRGYHSSPYFYLSFLDDIVWDSCPTAAYRHAGLLRWNRKGGFYQAV